MRKEKKKKTFCQQSPPKTKPRHKIVTETQSGHETLQRGDLEHGEQRLRKVVEGASPGLVKVELPPKELHAQQREDDDEEEEQEQQGGDGAHRVEQRGHQVGKRVPVSVGEKPNGCTGKSNID